MIIISFHKSLIKFLYFYAVGAAILALGSFAFSQTDSQSKLHTESWTTADGLPQNSVRAIVRTSDGYLWMGTFEGLARFDGVNFTVFDMVNTPELKSNYVRALIEDKDKNLWIGIDGGGLVKYSNGHFQRFSSADGFMSNNVTSLVEDRRGRIWIGAEDGGLSVFDAGKFTSYTTANGLCDENVWAVEEDAEESVWIGTDSCLARLQNGKFETFTTSNGLSGNNIKAIRRSANGGVWIGSIGGLDLFRNGRFERFDAQQNFSDKSVQWLREDGDKNLWIGTQKNGLFRLSVSELNKAESIGKAEEEIQAIYHDSDDQLWVGTALSGLKKYQRPRIQSFNDFKGAALGYVAPIYESAVRSNCGSVLPAGCTGLKKESFVTFRCRIKFPAMCAPLPKMQAAIFGSAATASIDTTRGNLRILLPKTVYRPIMFFR